MIIIFIDFYDLGLGNEYQSLREDSSQLLPAPNVVDVKENGAINPYDNDGFQCLSCKQALPNVYMHCMGCELLKKEDFNVCVRCFRSG